MKEIWKDFEENYSISNLGRIKNNRTQRILKLRPNHQGYLKTNISINGKLKTIFPHRLVAEYFIPNPNNFSQVNHIDGCKENNIISNLEWITREGNMQHAWKMGLIKSSNERVCYQFDSKGNLINEFKSITDAANYINKGRKGIVGIIRCCKGQRKSAYGYLWKYK